MAHKSFAPELLPNKTLVWRGTLNSRANRESRRILASRGDMSGVQFLANYEIVFKRSVKKPSCLIDFWKHQTRPRVGSSSWLAGREVGECCDCGKITSRTYNDGKYFQCGTCADGVRHNGRALWRASLAGRKAAIKKMNEAKQEAAQVVEPAEIIPANDASFEDALTSGANTEKIKALGDHEAAQAGMAAYAETKQQLVQAFSQGRAA